MPEFRLLTNPVYTPHLHAWGWEVAVYLFLGGLVAGLMVMGGLLVLRKPDLRPRTARMVALLSPLLLGAGMLSLLLDLERPVNVWRFYTTFQVSSPMSWGSWILILAGLAMVGFFWGLWLPRRTPAWLRLRPLAWSNIGLGVALGVYTGFLLSLMPSRPLWHVALLPPLFLISGVSTGAAVIVLLSKDEGERHLMGRLDVWLLAAKAILFGAYGALLAAGGPGAREALAMVTSGSYAALFWIAVVLLGLLLPLVLELGLLMRHSQRRAGLIAASLVLAGGFALRWVAVFAGQNSQL